MAEEPIIDLHSDQYFMGEALRQAARAYEAEEVPVGAVVVREGRIIARAFNQVELLKDATAHAEMLVLTKSGLRLHGVCASGKSRRRDLRSSLYRNRPFATKVNGCDSLRPLARCRPKRCSE